MTSPLQLDHIIILVPHSLLASIPSSLSNAFTISPGGRHADGATENVLVVLRDGVYLELIAFADEARKPDHWW
ncbi:MAG: VOC family protein, partial [Terriglobus roseus]|nr:VOC family protein [Terriglobus roseus]